MKLPASLADRLDVWRQERLRLRSLSPTGKGWCADRQNPRRLYVLGVQVQTDHPYGFTLEDLELRYGWLKADLTELSPGFDPGVVVLAVHAGFAGRLLEDRVLLSRLRLRRRSHRSLKALRRSHHDLDSLRTEIVLDGDPVKLSIQSWTYFPKYAFRVVGHPSREVRQHDGWCQPSHDVSGAVSFR